MKGNCTLTPRLIGGLPSEEITEAQVFQIAGCLADKFAKEEGKPDSQVL